MKVAIVGAGIAGLSCAGVLEQAGLDVALFDKGKRPGGRLSSLVLEAGQWDFGAPYVLARDPDFVAEVARWQRLGVAAPWPEGPPGAIVGIPAMQALVAAQCAGRPVRFNALVQRLEQGAAGWRMVGPELDEGGFAAMVVAVPAEQAAALLLLHDLALAGEAAAVRSAPCWTAMVGFAEAVPEAPAFLRDEDVIAWAAPGRGDPAERCWVIQADPHWSRAHLEARAEDVAPQLLHLLAERLGPLPQATFLKAHRWRYARPVTARALLAWNGDLRLGACGDWCAGSGIEAAWLSGRRLGLEMVEALRLAPTARSARRDYPPSASAVPASRAAAGARAGGRA